MKILILNNYYYPNMEGGAEYSVKLLAEALVKIGIDVNVLCMDGEPYRDVLEYETVNGVKVYRSYSKSLYRRRVIKDKAHIIDKIFNGVHSIYNYKMNCDLKKIIHIVCPDVIHTQNLVSMSYFAWKYASTKKIPVVHTLRDYWLLDPTTNIGKTPKLFELLFRYYHRFLSNKYVDIVTSPSERTMEIFVKEEYFRSSIRKIVVNSIEFDNSLLENCLIEKCDRKNEIIRYIYAGKVTESKGIKVLINCFLKCNVNAELIICGSGDLDNWIKEKKCSRIKQLGKLNQMELFNEYKRADVMIVPSLWEEPFGRIVIEGAQYGLPIIGSNKGGIPEIINSIKFGDIFDSDNELELVQLITKYSNRNYLNELYKVGPQKMGKYALNRQVEDFFEIYEQIEKEDN